MSHLCCLQHLVDHLVLGTSLRREAQHSHTRIVEASHRLGGLCCADGNLSKLVGIGHRCHSDITDHNHAVLTILRLLCDEQHRAADAGDTGGTLDNLQGGTQGFTRCRESTRYLSIGTFGLDDHATQVERILHQLAGFLDGHALLLAQFSQQLGIFLATRIVQRVDDGCLVDVLQSILLGISLDALGVTNENDVGQIVGQYSVGSAQGALFFGLRKHDTLLVGFRTCHDLL